ncbi:MAG: histidine phosphatase family protein [Micavibrio sp.]|nr:histidine phosphatase family protein [Micavibrio sp.]
MKTIYLLRHAHADPAPNAATDDHDRTLSARGEREAENLGAFMKDQKLVPDAMFCSTSTRTRETARIAFRQLFGDRAPVATRFDRLFYLAAPESIIEEIETADNRYNTLLVVGHNPGLEDMAELLARAGGQEIGGFPPCTLAAFTLDIDAWHNFNPRKAKLKTVFMP